MRRIMLAGSVYLSHSITLKFWKRADNPFNVFDPKIGMQLETIRQTLKCRSEHRQPQRHPWVVTFLLDYQKKTNTSEVKVNLRFL